jgi:hypothetical protein
MSDHCPAIAQQSECNRRSHVLQARIPGVARGKDFTVDLGGGGAERFDRLCIGGHGGQVACEAFHHDARGLGAALVSTHTVGNHKKIS